MTPFSPMTTFDKWIKATKELGFPIVVAAMLLYCGWSFLQSQAATLDTLITDLRRCNTSNTASNSQYAASLHELVDLHKNMLETQQNILKTEQRQTEIMERLGNAAEGHVPNKGAWIWPDTFPDG